MSHVPFIFLTSSVYNLGLIVFLTEGIKNRYVTQLRFGLKVLLFVSQIDVACSGGHYNLTPSRQVFFER